MSTRQQPQAHPPRVFISYSQHDPAHSQRVLALALTLAKEGIDVELDQFHQHELIDWPRWCEEQLRPEKSDFVLMICSAEYKRRIEGHVPADTGRGVYWEGAFIDDYLYEAKANERFVAVLLDDEPESSIPRSVRGWTRFRVRAFGLASGDTGYKDLYRLLTHQRGTPKPEPGRVITLAPEPAPELTAAVPPGKPTNLPYPSLGPLFKGRDDFLARIHAAFRHEPGRMQAIITRQAIHGLGGIGKTRAAVEYTWRYAGDYTALLFVTAQTPVDFRAKIAGLCATLRIAQEVIDETARFEAAIRWLADGSHHGWLLIVDNVDTPEAAEEVEKSLATLHGGHVLITGRLSEWPADIDVRRLDVLDAKAATEFLLARTEGKRQPCDDDPAQARELARELDGLALALEQAGAFVRRHNLSLAEYRRRWQEADQRVRQWHDGRTMQYERPLATTWQTTIDKLPPAARALLDLLAWLAPEPLPRFLFDHDAAPVTLRDQFKQKEAPRQLLRALSGDPQAEPESALAALRDFSLLQPADGVRFVTEGQLHRVLALITRERQSQQAQTDSLKASLALVNAAAVGDPDDVRCWPVWDPLRPHVRSVVDFADQRGITEPTGRLLNQLALVLHTKAQHAEAEPLMRRALEIDEKSFGPEHPNVAIRLNNLASLLQATNRLAEAEPLMRRALEIDEKSFGPEHPKVAIRLNNLASLLQATNRLAEAEPLMRRALEIVLKFTRATGHLHPHIRARFGNYIGLLQEMSLAQEEIGERLAQVGRQAGFDAESYRQLLNRLSG